MLPARVVLVVLALLAGLVAGGAPAPAAPPPVARGVVWDVTTVAPGGAVVAHGKVPGTGKRKLRMQVKIAGGWRTFGSTRTNRKGRFSISAPLNWYGVHTVRLTTAGKRPFRKKTTVQVVLPYTPRGNPADWVPNTNEAAGPERFAPDPCRTLTYLVNVDDVGPAGLAMVQFAMTEASYASGIPIRYLGPSSLLPLHTGTGPLPGGADLLIGWGTKAEIPELPANNAAGLTTQTGKLRRDGRGDKVNSVIKAEVALDTDEWNSGNYSLQSEGSSRTFGDVVLHEVGHVFGLDHTTATDEVMLISGAAAYPDGVYRTAYGAGDLAGLSTLGLAAGCHRG